MEQACQTVFTLSPSDHIDLLGDCIFIRSATSNDENDQMLVFNDKPPTSRHVQTELVLLRLTKQHHNDRSKAATLGIPSSDTTSDSSDDDSGVIEDSDYPIGGSVLNNRKHQFQLSRQIEILRRLKHQPSLPAEPQSELSLTEDSDLYNSFQVLRSILLANSSSPASLASVSHLTMEKEEEEEDEERCARSKSFDELLESISNDCSNGDVPPLDFNTTGLMPMEQQRKGCPEELQAIYPEVDVCSSVRLNCSRNFRRFFTPTKQSRLDFIVRFQEFYSQANSACYSSVEPVSISLGLAEDVASALTLDGGQSAVEQEQISSELLLPWDPQLDDYFGYRFLIRQVDGRLAGNRPV